MSVHRQGKGVKRQKVFFVLTQASHRFGIALSIFGFEGGQLDHCLLFCWLLPDAHQFGLDFPPLSSWDGAQDVALLVDEAALAWVAAKSSLTAASKPSCPSVTMRSIWVAPRVRRLAG